MSGKVVVFGSCNIDVFMHVPALDFFCQTGTGAQDGLHLSSHKIAAGGKGANQAIAAARAGGKVHFYGALGAREESQFLVANFKANKVNAAGLAFTKQPTGMAAIFVKPDGRHKMVISHGANMLAKAKQVPDSLLGKGNILVLQTEVDLKENLALLKRARKGGARTIYNIEPSAKLTAKDLVLIDYLVMNEAEACGLAAQLGIKEQEAASLAQILAKNFGPMCIITRGDKGVVACDAGAGGVLRLPALKVKAVDSVGAGDAFTGALAAALANGADAVTALSRGVVAGALACTRVGAQTALPTDAEISKMMHGSILQRVKKA